MVQRARRNIGAAAVGAIGAVLLASIGTPATAAETQTDAPTHSNGPTSQFQIIPAEQRGARTAKVTSQDSPETLARAFLAGKQSHIRTTTTELVLGSVQPSAAGGTVVRFSQHLNGVPVFGAETLVDLDKNGNVRSAAAETATSAPNMTPTVNQTQAEHAAVAEVAKTAGVNADTLRATTPQQRIYDPRILDRPGGDTTLVWQMYITNSGGEKIEQLVLVDAHTGIVALSLNQLRNVLERRVCDGDGIRRTFEEKCVTPVRIEGGPATNIAEVDHAYDYTGDTYDFFSTRFGRNSIDNLVMAVVSTARYCETDQCPYENAGWAFMASEVLLGDGFAAADDVVAHEVTHGVTTYMSNLIYSGQSGAINESLSDTFGEYVDLTNIGENVVGFGPVRDMAHPETYSHPDRLGSPLYDLGEDSSVHTNSGVGNKFTYLLTDGGNFNGHTITGLGLTKAPQIIYWAANLLTPNSNYVAYGQALQASCASLIGSHGITKADCAQVASVVHSNRRGVALKHPKVYPVQT